MGEGKWEGEGEEEMGLAGRVVRGDGTERRINMVGVNEKYTWERIGGSEVSVPLPEEAQFTPPTIPNTRSHLPLYPPNTCLAPGQRCARQGSGGGRPCNLYLISFRCVHPPLVSLGYKLFPCMIAQKSL